MAKRCYYEVLGVSRGARDSEVKAAFRRLAKECHPDSCNGGHGFGADFSASMSAMFDDLFGEFMGQRRPRQRSARERGSDLRYNMEITLSEAYQGKTAQIRVPTSVTCESCSGSGAKAGTAPTTCRTCGGVGQGRASHGFFTIQSTGSS